MSTNFSQLDFNQKKSIYNDIWSSIHQLHLLPPHSQYSTIIKFFSYLHDGGCLCGMDGYKIFAELICCNVDNFIWNITNYDEFWQFFHDLINLKLNKNTFIYK